MTSPPPTVEREPHARPFRDADQSSVQTNPDARAPHLRRSFLGEWRWWMLPALVALVLAYLFRDPFAGDWDSLDYTVLALHGEPSSMLFGRMLFIFINHLVWRAAHALFQLQPADAYLLFKYMVICESPLAVAACWKLARDLTGSVRAATLASALVVLSPFYVIYSGQAMTEIPSILLLAVALILHLRGLVRGRLWLVLLGATLLGAGVNMREGLALYGVWLACAPFVAGWRFSLRNIFVTAAVCALFLFCAVAPFAYFYLWDVGGYAGKWHGWVASTKMEAALHPVSIENFRMLLFWFFVASPLVLVTLPFALYREWRERGLSLLLLMALVGLFSNLALITHYSMVINGRYLLTGLPALVPLTAVFLLRTTNITRKIKERFRRGSLRRDGGEPAAEGSLMEADGRLLGAEGRLIEGGSLVEAGGRLLEIERRAFLPALVLVCLVGLMLGAKAYQGAWPTIQSHGMTAEYRARLRPLPEDAVVMAGGQTVAVSFWRGVGLGRWDWIGTGGGWPGARLEETIENYLRDGRRVFLDADPRLWSPRGWQLEETRAIVGLASRFRFRRISETIYEIRPLDDPSANDTPPLERLLPENR